MNASTEYTSLAAFTADDKPGFVILHQEKALGNDFREMEDNVTPALAERFQFFRDELAGTLGQPTQEQTEWELGVPTWASGNGYALWRDEQNFTSVFVSWDNPEDPSFVIAARALVSELDPSPGAPDPWGSKWMEKGEW